VASKHVTIKSSPLTNRTESMTNKGSFLHFQFATPSKHQPVQTVACFAGVSNSACFARAHRIRQPILVPPGRHKMVPLTGQACDWVVGFRLLTIKWGTWLLASKSTAVQAALAGSVQAALAGSKAGPHICTCKHQTPDTRA
jgi:hypothetical protein